MASPGELKAVLAAAVGLPEATLISHDRLLHHAGLRSKSGRGSGAARVSARDAAMLLTAVLGSAQVRDCGGPTFCFGCRPGRFVSRIWVGEISRWLMSGLKSGRVVTPTGPSN